MDISVIKSRKLVYMVTKDKDLSQSETAIPKELNILKDYFITWKLKSNLTKTEVAYFHLSNRLDIPKLNAYFMVLN